VSIGGRIIGNVMIEGIEIESSFIRVCPTCSGKKNFALQ
jgi:hypothetical protein